ncbi:hypothetical protein VE03_10623 [Pseudogymnoascus sp. 23342-1-I1]|nr:hypothetical protein VE03_10623 [Pseudogymnoascus sp. 23342-1-I1]
MFTVPPQILAMARSKKHFDFILLCLLMHELLYARLSFQLAVDQITNLQFSFPKAVLSQHEAQQLHPVPWIETGGMSPIRDEHRRFQARAGFCDLDRWKAPKASCNRPRFVV